MRTPEEWYDLFLVNKSPNGDLETIEQIQNEAYNQAIEDAAENATLCYQDGEDKKLGYVHAKTRLIVINKQSILKLQK